MKKTLYFLCVIALLLFAACQKQEQEQEKETIPEAAKGYGEVSWGASVEEVRKAYGIGEEVETVANENDPNLTTLRQDKVSEVISGRVFNFNEGKLYAVSVGYDPKKVSADNLEKTLDEKYGPYFYEYRRFILGSAYTDYRCYTTYLPRHSVEYGKSFQGGLNDYLFVYYRWAEFDDKYKQSKIERVEL